MEKFESKIKEQVNIEIPRSIDDKISVTLQQLPRKKRFSKLQYGLSAAVLIFLLTFGVSIFSPTFADTLRTLPVIGSVFELVGNTGIKQGSEKGLTTVLGEQVEAEGQIITFTESLYDGSEIHVGYIIESLTDAKYEHFDFHNIQLKINGKSLGNYSFGAAGKEIDNGNYVGTLSISSQDKFPDNFTLQISYKGRERWNVSLPVELQGDNKSFLVNQMREQGEIAIHYDKVTFFPTATEIAFRFILDEKVIDDPNYKLFGYEIIDDQGRELEPFGGGGGGAVKNGKLVQNFKFNFEPLTTIPKSLTIKTYRHDINEAKPVMVKERWQEEEKILSQGEIGSLKIIGVKQENEETIVTYFVEGESINYQASALWLEDKEGHQFHSDHGPKRVEGEINLFQRSFQGAPTIKDGLFIGTTKLTPLVYFDDLKIEIEFK